MQRQELNERGCVAAVLVALTLLVPLRPMRAQDRTLAITNATLIDGTGAAARTGVTILVRNGLIAGVMDADRAAIPDGTPRLDASGKFVIPGLADMHVHFGTGGRLPFDSLTVDRVLRQFLYYGVTTVFNVGATGGSLDDVLALRRRQDQGRLMGPHVYATGGLITVPGSHPVATIMHQPNGVDPDMYDWSKRGVWVVRTPDEMRRTVARLGAAGMDGVKIVVESGPKAFGDNHPQMSPALVAAAVEEADRRGLEVFVHATSLDELEVALAHHVHAIMHLVADPAPPRRALLDAMAERRTYYVPTLSLFIWTGTWGDPAQTLTDPFLTSGIEARVIKSLVESPLAPKSPPSSADWAWRRGLLGALKAASDAGVPIVAGTDTGNPFVFPGYSMHEELELMVEAGLTPMEALVAATRRAAEMLGAEDTFGTVTAGKRADLLILGKNPLEDIRNTRTLEVVIRGGNLIDRSSLLVRE
jgi:imidazolonepropionase-like amidohydrolase